MTRPQISVIGASRANDVTAAVAEAVGREVARSGAILVCGGLTGVMEAAARGAAEGGGEVLGIVPHLDRSHANRYCTHVVATGIGHARNLAVVASGDAVIAIGGQWGTLSEIAFAAEVGRPVFALASWDLSGPGELEGAPQVRRIEDPADAVARALEAAGRSRPSG